jgi:hypothetical protein
LFIFRTFTSITESVKGLHQHNPLLLYGGGILFVTVLTLLFRISTAIPEDPTIWPRTTQSVEKKEE